MLDACGQNGVGFMDGVMFMHSQRLKILREVLDDPAAIGDIRRINAAFTFCAPRNFMTGTYEINPAWNPMAVLGMLAGIASV